MGHDDDANALKRAGGWHAFFPMLRRAIIIVFIIVVYRYVREVWNPIIKRRAKKKMNE